MATGVYVGQDIAFKRGIEAERNGLVGRAVELWLLNRGGGAAGSFDPLYGEPVHDSEARPDWPYEGPVAVLAVITYSESQNKSESVDDETNFRVEHDGQFSIAYDTWVAARQVALDAGDLIPALAGRYPRSNDVIVLPDGMAFELVKASQDGLDTDTTLAVGFSGELKSFSQHVPERKL